MGAINVDDLNRYTDEEFRFQVRQFLADNYPASLRNPTRRLRLHEIREWLRIQARLGWIAPNWPAEFGGMGLSPRKLLILIEEQERCGVAQTPDMGVTMVGPLLIKHGTDEQRREFLPKILSGEHIWCQGYSEPSAGSDLASLRTDARLEGNEFVVNGQKIWTTLAHDATHIFLLVRTQRDKRKHSGISFLLASMAVAGISVRPIRNIAGHEDFCEVFFENVRVPAGNLVGALHEGWNIAKTLLGFERLHVGSPKHARHALEQLHRLAVEAGIDTGERYLERRAELLLDVQDLESLYERFARLVRDGKEIGPDIAGLKIWATECFQRIALYMMEISSELACIAPGADELQARATDALSFFYRSLPPTIYSGTNEIMRNILARDVLGLPLEH